MDFWKLFTTALVPVLKVLLVTGLGTFLGLQRFNLLRESAARNHLNALVYFVFTPALVCSILAKTITFESLVLVWFMPLNILFTFIIGTALGWLCLKITKAASDMQGLVLGCCAAGNLGNMPLIIIPAVCKDSGTPFGAVDVCNKKGMAYASLSMAISNIYIWTFVYHIIRVYSCRNFNVNKVDNSTVGPVSAIEADLENHSSTPEVTAAHTNDLVTQFKSDTILGLIIGVVPPFQKMFVGDDAPFRVVEDSASLLGDACIPAMTLLVGANLLNGFKRSELKVSLLVGIIVVRYMALPILGVVIVKGAIRFGIIHQDPLYHFILLLQYALPPAIGISTITQLFGAGETECSIVMLATNVCASFTLTLWSTFFMWLVL
ncbi:hypothetical protein ACSQ67_026236 [Phaseolus vulgaris]